MAGLEGCHDGLTHAINPTQASMKLKRILFGVAIGLATAAVTLLILIQTLGNIRPTVIQGQTLSYWATQVNATEANASNQANAILNAEIIPQLTQVMFHDTNDSTARLALIDGLNGLPGIYIPYAAAPERRSEAAWNLGDFGPAAKAAIPSLIRALQSRDPAIHPNAIKSLGAIHGEPEVVIPLLTKYLADDQLSDEAAAALGNFGGLAREAIPKILPLLKAPDKDARVAAAKALKQIDPATYENATNPPAK